MKVLVIDDEADIRRIARLALEKIGGMEVAESEGGPGTAEKALAEKPDAILLDVRMPGLDGPAVLAALRRQEGTAQVPVIFLTAATTPAEVERLTGLGATGVLKKPFDPRGLAGRVRSLLNS
jgi:DNA-binding response OmpR family regulator